MWMFGSRTTVKKVRNSLTWFSQIRQHGRGCLCRENTATCLEVWSGDHRQTPGGLKMSKESKAFRKKLTKRPLALRCQTQYIQAHDFGDVVMRYLDCPKDSFTWKTPATPDRQLCCHRSCSWAVLARGAYRQLTSMS